MRKNDEVLWLLEKYFLQFYYEDNVLCSLIIDWFDLAINIKAISFDIARYDDSLLYCGMAWDYEEERFKKLTAYNLELVKFHYIFGAFESLVKLLIPNDNIKKWGKVNAACGWLKSHNIQDDLLDDYLRIYNETMSLLNEIKSHPQEFIQIEIEEKDYVDLSGKGLALAYKIRNLFAHGALMMPSGYNEDEDKEAFEKMLTIFYNAQTLVIMTMIMLLLVDVKNDNEKCYDSVYLPEIDGLTQKEFLFNVYNEIIQLRIF